MSVVAMPLRGRPRKETEALTEVLSFACTKQEADAMHVQARQAGYKSVSAYIRKRTKELGLFAKIKDVSQQPV